MKRVKFVFYFYFCKCMYSCSTTFVEKTILAPLYCLCSFVKKQLTILMWVYFWALSSIVFSIIIFNTLPSLCLHLFNIIAYFSTLTFHVSFYSSCFYLKNCEFEKTNLSGSFVYMRISTVKYNRYVNPNLLSFYVIIECIMLLSAYWIYFPFVFVYFSFSSVPQN